MIRFGLCCKFNREDIAFRATTARAVSKLSQKEIEEKISKLCLHNLYELLKALKKCKEMNIKAFRVMSPLFPLYTHPDFGYSVDALNCSNKIYELFKQIKLFSTENGIRTSFHPDQFVLLSSPDENIINKSIEDLDYQLMLAENIGADAINIHAGGAYGDKQSTIKKLIKTVKSSRLSNIVKYLTFENDDRIYTAEDIFHICSETGLPMVYDVHHHRCNPDSLTIQQATDSAIKTWGLREPLFHISSPKMGWNSKNPRSHSDYIDVDDFPLEWISLENDITLDIEAKAKEDAIMKLRNDLIEKYNYSDNR